MPSNDHAHPDSSREHFASLLQSVLEKLGPPTLDQIVRASQGSPAPLNKSSVSEWRRGKSLPETPELLESLLRAMDRIAGVRGAMDRDMWLRAYTAARQEEPFQPTGELIRVRDFTPLELGVHPARSPSTAAAVPSYIPRDVDAQVRGVLDRLCGEGGMLLLTGDSAVGKTRTAFEAITAVTPDHFLVAPRSNHTLGEEITSAVDLAGRGRPTVLWLNDAERFLGPTGLEMRQFRRLRSARVPIIATMRDSFLSRQAREGISMDVLNLADEIHLDRLWSQNELIRARQALDEQGDRRVAEALRMAEEHGIAEYLAAGPHLWRELLQAPRPRGNPRGAALVHAAIDLARAGIRRPVALELLTELHEHHLPGINSALLSPEPLEEALAWATEARFGVTRHLLPHADGWQAFDYLVDAVLRQEEPPPVSDHTWATALTLAGEKHERYDVAFSAFANERPDIGDQALLPLAKGGDVMAMRSLGLLHRRINPQRARKWLKRAVATGDVVSMRLLGNQHVLQGQWDKGVKWYRRAAKSGDLESEAFFREPVVYQQPSADGTEQVRAEVVDEDEDYDESEPWSPSPRTLEVLAAALDIACDMTYDAIEDIGGKPIKAKSWAYPLDQLPSQTWRQSRRWRRAFARCYDDLAEDIRAGIRPRPRCTGEEMALHIALAHASAMTLDEMELVEEFTEGIPPSPHDYDWDECKDLLFEDHDVLWLYWPWMSGIEDPENPINGFASVANLRPDDWFIPFRADDARDPDRGHRR
ncbi:tetratricopeptide repeat protein [Streptomyces venezuelae]|uniref:tetratricopeptide repeat protein n=1 Tax=Streptomyces venezuelae TaxID=54571 RepID=UPI00363D246D